VRTATKVHYRQQHPLYLTPLCLWSPDPSDSTLFVSELRFVPPSTSHHGRRSYMGSDTPAVQFSATKVLVDNNKFFVLTFSSESRFT